MTGCTRCDVAIVGAGAAGLFCAARAGRLGAKVLLIDHCAKLAEKIRISGGGRCNFTNLDAGPAYFHSANPDYCRSALSRYTPRDFVALLQRHGIGWHEKHKGQLFCDEGSGRVIQMLLAECAAGGVERWQPCRIGEVGAAASGFALDTDRGAVHAQRLVIATGGLSMPKLGATDFGYRVARQFGLRVVEPRPGLVPLTFGASDWADFAALAGVSLPVTIGVGTHRAATRFEDDLLFTHRGLSGPAVLQASTLWTPGAALHVDLVPAIDVAAELRAAKLLGRRRLGSVLGQWLPQRLAQAWLVGHRLGAERAIAECRDRDLDTLARALADWTPIPSGNEGWRKAEVTAGGVDTRDLDSRTMGARSVPGLHFIGEVVDVTGWLGGYNFQWAWASAAACAEALVSG